MTETKDLYFEIRGHGQVSREIALGTMLSSSVDGAAIFTYSGGQQFFAGNEGAEVVVRNSPSARLKDGRYILGNIGASQLELTGSGITSGASNSVVNSNAWIDDLYKFCSGPAPAYVRGEKAKARWIKCVADISDSIGQKIGSSGGVAKVDGFTIDVLKLDNEAIDRICAFNSPSITPVFSDTIGESLTTTDSTITLLEDVAPSNLFLSLQTTFNSGTVYINNEAIKLNSYSSQDLSVDRACLKTIGQPHVNRSTIFQKIQSGLGKIIDVYRYQSQKKYLDNPYQNPYDNNFKLYTGNIDELDFDDAMTSFQLKISSLNLQSRVQSANNSLNSTIILLESGQVADRLEANTTSITQNDIFTRYAQSDRLQRDIFDFNNNIMANIQEDIAGQWSWIKFDKFAIKITRRVLEKDTEDDNNSYFQYGNYNIKSNLTTRQSGELTTEKSNNIVMLEPFENREDQYKNSDTVPIYILGIGSNTELTTLKDLNNLSFDLESLFFSVNIPKLIAEGKKPELCHVFESQIWPNGWKSGYDNTSGPNSQRFKQQTSISNEVGLVEEFYRPPIYIGEIILQILTSQNGNQSNSIYDVLPFGLGFGIPIDDIDLESFGLCGPCKIPLNTVFLEQKDFEKMDKWLDKNILKPFGLVLSTSLTGKITINSTALDGRITAGESSGIEIVNPDRSILYIADSSKNLKVNIDPNNIFSSYSIIYKKPLEDYSSPEYARNFKFLSGDSKPKKDGGTVYSRSSLYGSINSNPIKYEIKFSLYSPSDLIGIGSDIITLYGAATSVLSFEVPGLPDTELSKLSLGSIHTIAFNSGQVNIYNSQGKTIDVQDELFVFIVLSVKYDIFNNTVQLSGILLDQERIGQNFVKRIGPSYRPTAINTSTKTITYDTGYYQDFSQNDIFPEAGDQLLLYNKEFTLLSVDGSGDPQSRVVQSVNQTEIILDDNFTDSSGNAIPYQDGLIIMHDSYTVQSSTSKDRILYQKDPDNLDQIEIQPPISFSGFLES